eukprot:GHVH01007047.1.p1 GENE.GHVH01007047.1~~GHVH01007047.1.p1  ORF type:complete len:298 (+),score=24.65 GHVH01007047.1:16-909(+)
MNSNHVSSQVSEGGNAVSSGCLVVGSPALGAYPSHKRQDGTIGSFTVGARHSCYLLRSIPCPAKSYVGYTTNVSLRLRRHNRVVKGGAKKTSRHTPWEVVAVVSDFRCGTSARQFEFAWMHPGRSRHLARGTGLTSSRTLSSSIDTLVALLGTENALSLAPLTVSWIDASSFSMFRSKLGNTKVVSSIRLDQSYMNEFEKYELAMNKTRLRHHWSTQPEMYSINERDRCSLCHHTVNEHEAVSRCPYESERGSKPVIAHLRCIHSKEKVSSIPLQTHWFPVGGLTHHAILSIVGSIY